MFCLAGTAFYGVGFNYLHVALDADDAGNAPYDGLCESIHLAYAVAVALGLSLQGAVPAAE